MPYRRYRPPIEPPSEAVAIDGRPLTRAQLIAWESHGERDPDDPSPRRPSDYARRCQRHRADMATRVALAAGFSARFFGGLPPPLRPTIGDFRAAPAPLPNRAKLMAGR